MRSAWLASLWLIAGCRRDPPPPRPVVPRVAPARPASMLLLAETGELHSVLGGIGALRGGELPPAALVAAAFGLEPSVLAVVAWRGPARLAVVPEGWALALPVGDPREIEPRLGTRGRLREESDLGAWVVTGPDPNPQRPCAILAGAEGEVRLVCGSSRAAVRALGPWLAATPVAATGPGLRATVPDAAWSRTWAPGLGSLLGMGADWLGERASEARATQGVPTYGDPEPIVAAIRAGARRVAEHGSSLRDLRAELVADARGLHLSLRARVADDAPAPMRELLRGPVERPSPLALTVPSRGLGLVLRIPGSLARPAIASTRELALEVVGARLGDRAAVERSLSELLSSASGEVSYVGSFEAERSSWALQAGLSELPAARRALGSFARAPWWSGLQWGEAMRARPAGARVEILRGNSPVATLAVEDPSLVIRGGAGAPTGATERHEQAVAGLGANLGSSDGGAMRAWLGATGNELSFELHLGAAWLRLAGTLADARDR